MRGILEKNITRIPKKKTKKRLKRRSPGYLKEQEVDID